MLTSAPRLIPYMLAVTFRLAYSAMMNTGQSVLFLNLKSSSGQFTVASIPFST